MAMNLESFPKTARTAANRKYPWEQWKDGRVWKAEAGVDFKIEPKGFRAILYEKGKASGLSVRTKIDGRFVIFQFKKIESMICAETGSTE